MDGCDGVLLNTTVVRGEGKAPEILLRSRQESINEIENMRRVGYQVYSTTH